MIPAEALDDRLAFVGTAGSGKTYTASAAVERLLARHARCVIVDPLDVWWGLRLLADGVTPSPHKVVIFGGAHGDLPLNEHAGALIGETAAGMAESCIVSLGGLATKSAERRFMLAFLDAIYRKTDPRKSDPYHIIFDEADLWAPQKSSEPMLQSRMEEIVRRGRVRGFIPWLITQRPAVLSKDVLSQADGLIALKLTSSQDRDAIGAWIEGQADKQEGKAILASLPTMQQGQGVVWIPGRGILTTEQFPAKKTFDSSRTPKRGEKRTGTALKPLDLGALREKLASVEADTKANDPKALKAELAALKKQMADAVKHHVVADPAEIEAAEDRGYDLGFAEGVVAARAQAAEAAMAVVQALRRGEMPDVQPPAGTLRRKPGTRKPAPVAQRIERPVPDRKAVGSIPPGSATLSRPQQRILDALAWLESVGVNRADRVRAALLASQSHKSSGFEKNVSTLKTAGLISYPTPGDLALTDAGRDAAVPPAGTPTTADLHQAVRDHVSGPQWRMLEALCEVYPESLTRKELAERSDQSELSSGFEKNVSTLRSFGFVDYPDRGLVAATAIMFVER